MDTTLKGTIAVGLYKYVDGVDRAYVQNDGEEIKPGKITIKDHTISLWSYISDFVYGQGCVITRKLHKWNFKDVYSFNYAVESTGQICLGIRFTGKLAHWGNREELESLAIASFDNFKTVYVTLRYTHKKYSYRGAPSENRTIDGFTDMVCDKETQDWLINFYETLDKQK